MILDWLRHRAMPSAGLPTRDGLTAEERARYEAQRATITAEYEQRQQQLDATLERIRSEARVQRRIVGTDPGEQAD